MRMSGGRTRRAAARAAALAVASLLAAGLAVTAALPRAAVLSPGGALRGLPAQRDLQLVVLPHPDDEVEAWTQVAGRPRTYTVLVLLTHGERSAHCRSTPARLARLVLAGARLPAPLPLDLDRAGCARARLDAWHAFLDAAARADPTLDPGPVHVVRLRTGAGPGEVEVGPRGARVVLDLGDGRLTADGVRRAVRTTLGLVGGVLPDLPVTRVVGSAYYADPALARPGGDPASTCPLCDASPLDTPYAHPDHGAVQTALRTTWFGVPALVVTGPHDPRATLRAELSAGTYARLMRLPGDGPAGSVQRAYGWLKASPGWPAGVEADGRSFMTRVQHFVVVDGPGSVQ